MIADLPTMKMARAALLSAADDLGKTDVEIVLAPYLMSMFKLMNDRTSARELALLIRGIAQQIGGQ